MRRFLLSLVALGLAPLSYAGEIPNAQIVLEVVEAPAPGRYPEQAPPRFVLLDKGQVFVGGTQEIHVGRLESAEVKEIDNKIARIRKLQGLGSQVTLGSGRTRYRLLLLGKRPLEIVGTGDPQGASSSLQPLAALLLDLIRFDHASLRLYRPESFQLIAREGTLAGGCRPWGFGFPPAEAATGRVVPAATAGGWPHGAIAGSACAGAVRYVVTLRPLLPGERP